MSKRTNMPEEKGLDHTITLVEEGYNFIVNRRESMQSNVFKTRVLGRSAYCLSGSEAAELFYDVTKFKRAGAAPLPAKKTLFGVGGVQGLDDEAHRHRKAMFMQLWTRESVDRLSQLTRDHYAKAAKDWVQQDEIVLYNEAKKILTQVACDWCGVPLAADEIEKRTDQLSLMFEKAGEADFSHFKGWSARSKTEDWIEDLIDKTREGSLQLSENTPFYKFIWHKDPDGSLLDKEIVAVEVLNLLRPTVANAVWIAFIGLALHDSPPNSELTNEQRESFCQEIRRFYPFFPFTVAKVREDFTWQGYEFEKDTLTLLDLYGTNHHPEEWDNPDTFIGTRFIDSKRHPFSFIPQGGGDYGTGHRCAGEWVTLLIMQETVDFLMNKISYQLPEQDLSYSLTEIPSLPKSRIRMRDIQFNTSGGLNRAT